MSSLILLTIQTQLSSYGYPILMILGDIGNVFIVILFSRQRQNPCALYLISSAIMNSVYLTFLGLIKIFPFYYGDGTIGALIFCKLFSYTLNILGQIPKTLVVLACVDRFLITNARATLRAFSTLKRARWFTFFSILFWSLFTIFVPIVQTIINGRCTNTGIFSAIYSIYAITLVGAVPAITLGIFGFLSYRNMRQTHLRVHPTLNNRINANNGIRRQDRDLLIIVISEVFVYIVTTILFPLILLEMMISECVLLNKSSQYIQIEYFILNIAYLLLFVNAAIPFYIYLISAQSFRRDFKQLIINTYRKLTRQPPILTVPRANQTLPQQETRV